MSYETIMYASIGAGIVLLTVSIIFFIYYRIPDKINDLTGRKAKREIEELQAKGRLTSKIRTVTIPGSHETEPTGGIGWLSKRKRKKTTLLPAADEKTGEESSYTEKLEVNETTGTMPLGDVRPIPGGQNATTLLTPGSMVFPESEKEEFVIKQRIMVIHTNEEIDSL